MNRRELLKAAGVGMFAPGAFLGIARGGSSLAFHARNAAAEGWTRRITDGESQTGKTMFGSMEMARCVCSI